MTKLNKYIAHSGYCSRRKATELIKEGKVKVNGKVVLEPFHELVSDETIKINNKLLPKPEQKLYFLFNKPKDVICTLSDPQNRTTISDFFSQVKERLYPIGRLDRNTTGLIIMTNDGELTQKLAHPKYLIAKTYVVTTHKPVKEEHLAIMKQGVNLEDGTMKVDKAQYVAKNTKDVVSITIHSGRKHIVKRLFKQLNYFVKKLDRTHFAGLSKRGLPLGHYRTLTQSEVKKLLKS